MKLEFRKSLTRAFKNLRKQGYFASHNFACCATCSWDLVSWDQADHAVFYHDQDKSSADKTNEVWLYWQGDLAVIRKAIEDEGLIVEHDGSPSTRIKAVWPF
jgi:hypothetical protein